MGFYATASNRNNIARQNDNIGREVGKMPEISIILPSIRPEIILQRINEFSITNRDLDYEIIVVSPFTVKGDKVVHIKEGQLGFGHAANTGYKFSSGKYVVYWGDRISPTINCLSNMLNFVKSNPDPFIGSFRMKDSRSKREIAQGCVYGKLFPTYPCASKNTINIIGGLIDPIFEHYWADPDMGLRTWEHGGKVEICPDAWLEKETYDDEIVSNNTKKFFDSGAETFFNRWHNTMGTGIKREVYTVLMPAGIVRIIGFFPSFIRPNLFNLYGRRSLYGRRFICWDYWPAVFKLIAKRTYQKVKGMTER